MGDFANIDFGFRYGSKLSMDNTSYKEGRFNIATDVGTLTVDIGGNRVTISENIITGKTEAEIRALTAPDISKLYFAYDTFNLLAFDQVSLTWKRCLGEFVAHAISAETDNEGNIITETYLKKNDADSNTDEISARIDELKENIDGSLEGINATIESLTESIGSLNKFTVVILRDGEKLPVVGENLVIYLVPMSATDAVPGPIEIPVEPDGLEDPDNSSNPDDGGNDTIVGADGDSEEDPDEPGSDDEPTDSEDEEDAPARTEDVYKEYIWVTREEYNYNDETGEVEVTTIGYYEQIGLTSADISNYYNKDEIGEITNEINSKINNISENVENNYYNKEDTDEKFFQATESLRGEISNLSNNISSNLTDNYYNIEQITGMIENIETSINEGSTTLSENYYTKTESDNKYVSNIEIEGNSLKITYGNGTESIFDIENISVSLDYGNEDIEEPDPEPEEPESTG